MIDPKLIERLRKTVTPFGNDHTWLIVNAMNLERTEAATALDLASKREAELVAEVNALNIKLDACNEHARIVTHERDWSQEVDVKAAENLVYDLQEALAFWLPSVSSALGDMEDRAADAAYLLAGFSGDVPNPTWADNLLARANGSSMPSKKSTAARMDVQLKAGQSPKTSVRGNSDDVLRAGISGEPKRKSGQPAGTQAPPVDTFIKDNVLNRGRQSNANAR